MFKQLDLIERKRFAQWKPAFQWQNRDGEESSPSLF